MLCTVMHLGRSINTMYERKVLKYRWCDNVVEGLYAYCTLSHAPLRRKVELGEEPEIILKNRLLDLQR